MCGMAREPAWQPDFVPQLELGLHAGGPLSSRQPGNVVPLDRAVRLDDIDTPHCDHIPPRRLAGPLACRTRDYRRHRKTSLRTVTGSV
jgi:hypothetical protein